MNIPITALDADRIAALAPGCMLEFHDQVESTQDLARTRLAGARLPCAIFAEEQTAGRGQRGRVWHSPRAAAIYCTLIWPSTRGLAEFSGLSLVVGLAVHAALAHAGLEARLKWPNDVLIASRKIAGILVEIGADDRGSWALIGIGLNYAMPPESFSQIDQPWVDLATLTADAPSRSEVAGLLLRALQSRLEAFERHGFAPFVDDWNAADALAGRQVWLIEGERRTRAQALGIDTQGRMRVIVDGRERAVVAGEVSLRHE